MFFFLIERRSSAGAAFCDPLQEHGWVAHHAFSRPINFATNALKSSF
jgi:hypothetical protein